MSLLMQALKKAEQSKQQMSEQPLSDSRLEDGRLPSMTSAEISLNSAVLEQVSTQPSAPLAAENSVLDMPGLSLSPRLEEAREESPANQSAQAAQASAIIENLDPPHYPTERATGHQHEAAKTTHPVAEHVSDGPTKAAGEKSLQERLGRTRIDPRETEQAAQKAALEEKEQQLNRDKAKTVFSSKAQEPGKRRRWVGLLIFALSTFMGGAAYIFWQAGMTVPGFSPMAQPGLGAVPMARPAEEVAVSAASGEASVETMGEKSGEPESVAVASPKILSTEQTTSAPAATQGSASKPSANAARRVISQSQSSLVKEQTDELAPSDAAGVIEIRKGQSGDQINPVLSGAYQSLIAGDFKLAEQQYQEVLQKEPNNRDALLGMAAISLNQRQADRSAAYYGKLLELDPNDPEAIAGLTGLQQGDPVQSESRLKKALSLHPHSASILFALGNLYAQQSRWSDAQQSYFRAYDLAPDNADYAFNLAVSLDRLRQEKLAKDYYQRALILAQRGSGNFSRSGVQKRIRELEME